MRIAICDDEKYFRNDLKKHLNDYARQYSLNFIYSEFSSGDMLLSSNEEFDLIFMDHQMSRINGIDTVRKLRQRSDRTVVIFVSNYKDIVFDSLKVQTHRFLVKPIDVPKLYEALNSFIAAYNSDKYVLVCDKENDKVCRISEASIIYAEADNIYCKVRTNDGSYIYKATLSKFEELLKSDFFYRSHRSYLVNFNYITNYTRSEICFENGEKALLTKTKHFEFQKEYMDFLKRKNISSTL